MNFRHQNISFRENIQINGSRAGLEISTLRNRAYNTCQLRSGAILGDGLGPLGNGVLSQLARQQQSGGGLDVLGQHGPLLASEG